MYLKQNKVNGRIHLIIAHGYWDKEAKKVKTKTIKSIGYLDELEKEYSDPISHFKQVVKEMNEKEKSENPPAVISLDKTTVLTESSEKRKNLGYAVLSKIYHELGLSVFFYNHSRKAKLEFNVNSIMRTEIFSRILFPGSKKKTYENREVFFENTDYTLVDVYRCLSHISTLSNTVQKFLHSKIKEQYNRNTELVYYDVTNYYFEIDKQDNMRKKGVSKEHRPNPIIQMGLFMDNMGIPISYKLFPGNTNDCETLIPMLMNMKEEYNIGRIIVVADKGINTARNIIFNLINQDGYVYSQSIRKGHIELKEYVLDPKGYRDMGQDAKIKSRIYPREICIKSINGKEKKVRIEEKQIILYSKDHDLKAKEDRKSAVLKAFDLVNNPANYNKATSYGATKYIKNIIFDEKTGEILTVKSKPIFDLEKLREEEMFDGYYAIITSECDKTDEEIINIYRGLWKIEESFKVCKSDFETRPIYLSRADRIQSHFLICFIALVIARILERLLDNRISVSKLSASLSRASCSPLEENWYLFDYVDDVIVAIKEKLGIDLTRKYLRLGEIKKLLADTKKV